MTKRNQKPYYDNPGSWADGVPPTLDDDVEIIDQPVWIRGDANYAKTIVIKPGGRVMLDPAFGCTFSARGNIILDGGALIATPPVDRSLIRTIRMVQVNEAAYVGGGHDPIDSDVGLWVCGNSELVLQGTPIVAWNRTGNDPSWAASDELYVTPTAVNAYLPVAFVKGSPVPVAVDHRGNPHAGEVVNLFRNVRIEGTPTGRAHVIFAGSTRIPVVEHVAIRYMGPRQDYGLGLDGVLARYGWHFHHCDDALEGTVVRGVLVRDCNSHAFVTHHTHGITYEDCLAYDTKSDAFWWDPEVDIDSYGQHSSNNVTYLRCGAVLTRASDASAGGVDGFTLGSGEGNRCIDCFAAAGQGGASTSAGVHWSSKANQMANVWEFSGFVSHNNKGNGLRSWQNDGNDHIVQSFTSYRNRLAGVEHGAYGNRYLYRDGLIFGNLAESIRSHAQSKQGGKIRWMNIDMDGKFRIMRHEAPDPEFRQLVYNCPMLSVHVLEATNTSGAQPSIGPGWYDYVHCPQGTNGHIQTVADFLIQQPHAASNWRVEQPDGTAFSIAPNGTVTSLPPFTLTQEWGL